MPSLCRLFADGNSLQCPSYNVANIEYVLNHDLKVFINMKELSSQKLSEIAKNSHYL